jgi:hypothetical protein
VTLPAITPNNTVTNRRPSDRRNNGKEMNDTIASPGKDELKLALNAIREPLHTPVIRNNQCRNLRWLWSKADVI